MKKIKNNSPGVLKHSSKLVLIPTPGVDYRSAKALLKDFHENKEFLVASKGCFATSLYITKDEIEKGTIIEFQFDTRGHSLIVEL